MAESLDEIKKILVDLRRERDQINEALAALIPLALRQQRSGRRSEWLIRALADSKGRRDTTKKKAAD